MKPRILLLFPPQRVDLYDFLENDLLNDYFILNFEHTDDKKNSLIASFIKGEYYWSDYLTPASLIKEISPDKIVFGEIFDIKQIALCVYANLSGIKTLFLDHGASGDLEGYIETHKKLKGFIFYEKFKKLPKNFFSIIRNRIFYYSTLFQKPNENSFKYFILPIYKLIYSSFYALHELQFSERIPSIGILFSKSNLKQLNYIYPFVPKQIKFTGIPYFDDLYLNRVIEKNYLVFIDTPFYEAGFYGWDDVHHKNVALKLNAFAISKSIDIHIKLHPRSDLKLWINYNLSERIKIHQIGNFTEMYNSAKLIIGFPSSVIIGLVCAKKNIVLVGWNPIPDIRGADISKLNLCHSSLYIDELDTHLDYWIKNNLCIKNEAAYYNFIAEYNYPFDGKASERIVNIITNA
jgi:hypothetical protein